MSLSGGPFDTDEDPLDSASSAGGGAASAIGPAMRFRHTTTVPHSVAGFRMLPKATSVILRASNTDIRHGPYNRTLLHTKDFWRVIALTGSTAADFLPLYKQSIDRKQAFNNDPQAEEKIAKAYWALYEQRDKLKDKMATSFKARHFTSYEALITQMISDMQAIDPSGAFAGITDQLLNWARGYGEHKLLHKFQGMFDPHRDGEMLVDVALDMLRDMGYFLSKKFDYDAEHQTYSLTANGKTLYEGKVDKKGYMDFQVPKDIDPNDIPDAVTGLLDLLASHRQMDRPGVNVLTISSHPNFALTIELARRAIFDYHFKVQLDNDTRTTLEGIAADPTHNDHKAAVMILAACDAFDDRHPNKIEIARMDGKQAIAGGVPVAVEVQAEFNRLKAQHIAPGSATLHSLQAQALMAVYNRDVPINYTPDFAAGVPATPSSTPSSSASDAGSDAGSVHPGSTRLSVGPSSSV